MTPCATALKEWAAICAALAAGRQSLLLRKGGLIERSDRFEVEHRRFWLYPTYLHQQEQGVAEADRRFLEEARVRQPTAGQVRIHLFAEVTAAWHLTQEADLAGLAPWHAWTPETIQARYHYRTPGLTLMVLRVYREAESLLTESAEQAGCRSWVRLNSARTPTLSEPVLGEAEHAALVTAVSGLVPAAARLS